MLSNGRHSEARLTVPVCQFKRHVDAYHCPPDLRLQAVLVTTNGTGAHTRAHHGSMPSDDASRRCYRKCIIYMRWTENRNAGSKPGSAERDCAHGHKNLLQPVIKNHLKQVGTLISNAVCHSIRLQAPSSMKSEACGRFPPPLAPCCLGQFIDSRE